MKIFYKNTMQDLIDLNLYILKNSSVIKKMLITYICYCFILVVIGAMLLYVALGRITPLYIVSTLLIFILSIVFMPKYIKWRRTKQVIKMVNEDKSGNMLSNTTLILDDKGITRDSSISSSKLDWKVVQKVSVTEKHIFIFINSISALIIPLEVFHSISEKESFLQIIHKNIKQS